MKKKGLLFICCLIVIGILSSCSKGNIEADKKTDEVSKLVEEQQEKTMTFCESWDFDGGFFTVLSPNLISNYGPYNFLSNFYDTLVKYEGNKIVPSLVEKWEISEDGREYTFHLKDGIKFSDGEELNADAVRKSIESVPKLLGEYNGAYGVTSTIIEKVEILDNNKVKIILKSPYYGALHDLTMINTFGIMSPNAYNEDGTLSEETKTKTFGTGAYMYKGERKGDSYHFVLNPYYTGKVPNISSFNVNTIPDNDAKLLALQSGEIDMILGSKNISYDSYKNFENEKGIKGIISERKDVTRFLGLNASVKPFDDHKVRLAINHAIDKNSIAKDIFHGFEDVANAFLSPDLPYCNVGLKGYDYNIEEAEKILDNAGWIKNANGIREKDGIELKGNLIYLSGVADEETLAMKISSDLAKIGIKLSPKGLERNILFQTISSGKYEAALQVTYGMPYDPYLAVANLNRQMIIDNLVAQGLVGVKDGDEMIIDVNTMVDEKEIQDQYKKILTGVEQSASLIPITYRKQIYLYRTDKIKDYKFYGIPEIYDIQGIDAE